jgi:hypothetical protein
MFSFSCFERIILFFSLFVYLSFLDFLGLLLLSTYEDVCVMVICCSTIDLWLVMLLKTRRRVMKNPQRVQRPKIQLKAEVQDEV